MNAAQLEIHHLEPTTAGRAAFIQCARLSLNFMRRLQKIPGTPDAASRLVIAAFARKT
jgi:hypothetical protein